MLIRCVLRQSCTYSTNPNPASAKSLETQMLLSQHSRIIVAQVDFYQRKINTEPLMSANGQNFTRDKVCQAYGDMK